MLKKDLLAILESLNEDDEVVFYVWDYEYDDEKPYEIGCAKFVDKSGKYINLGVHR